MEKFGIFELLDALSAATARENPPGEESPADPTPETSSPSVRDAAFSAPVYDMIPPKKEPSLPDPQNKPHSPAEPEGAAPQTNPSPNISVEAGALSGFYARHDAVAKKAKKQR